MDGEILSGAEFVAYRTLIGLGVPSAACEALGISRETLRSLDAGKFRYSRAAAICQDLLRLVEAHDDRVDEGIDRVRRGEALIVTKGDSVGMAVAIRVLDAEPDARVEWSD